MSGGKAKSPPEATAFAGLLTRRVRWGLSASGWLIVFSILVLGGVTWTLTIFRFLAVTERVEADVLVVEGWMKDYEMRGAAAEFASGGYQQAFTTGGPVSGTGGYTNDYNTSANVGADRLKAAGIPADRIQIVPSRVTVRDRTYNAAIALRDYLAAHQLQVRRINIATEAPHARRTRLLFQKALGDEIQVGVIAIANPDYNSDRWWEYSEGVKDVLSEGAAYLYARLFF